MIGLYPVNRYWQGMEYIAWYNDGAIYMARYIPGKGAVIPWQDGAQYVQVANDASDGPFDFRIWEGASAPIAVIYRRSDGMLCQYHTSDGNVWLFDGELTQGQYPQFAIQSGHIYMTYRSPDGDIRLVYFMFGSDSLLSLPRSVGTHSVVTDRCDDAAFAYIIDRSSRQHVCVFPKSGDLWETRSDDAVVWTNAVNITYTTA